ncbi:MAG: hypothetical protein OXF02_03470 [Simkaniaceae bacterium]|nr:hypothetical protein [Simkaniaceae bacterium]
MSIFARLMMFAVLIDQAREEMCRLFQSAMYAAKRRTYFWEKVRVFFSLYVLDVWSSPLSAVASKNDGRGLPIAVRTR